MIPKVGEHIKCVLLNNCIAEGKVVEWGDECTLSSLDECSFILISRKDIVLTKIFKKMQITSIENKFEEEYKKPSDDDLRTKNLAELKIELIEQEKKIVANKLKAHHIGQNKKVEYGQPGFFKKSSTE